MILFISDITKDKLIYNDRSGLVVGGRVVRGMGEQDYQEAQLSDTTKRSSSVLTVVHTCQNQPECILMSVSYTSICLKRKNK